MRRLALFDFDGTLTTRDTLLSFIRFYWGNARFVGGMLVMSPYLLAYKIKLIKNWQAKEKVLRFFFRDEQVEVFNSKCVMYCRQVLPALLRPVAVKRLNFHRDRGDRVIVVSASAENWIAPWTEGLGVELLATRLESRQGKLTGKLSGMNCYGREKELRIKAILDPSEYSEIFAYGDSRGDREMLAMAGNPMYRRFD